MSKRKHHFTVTSFADLAKVYPLAVTEKVIPEKREQKADYAYIAKLLDCQIVVPGIELTTGETVSSPEAADDTAAATTEQSQAAVPVSPEGKKSAFHEKLHSHQA